MRPFKVSSQHEVIIEGLSKGQSIRKIAASLELNPSTVLRNVAQLVKRAYISRTVRSSQVLYSILPKGMELMQHPLRNSLTGGSINATPPEIQKPQNRKIRLHRLQVKYDLVSAVKDPRVISFRDHPSKIVPMGPKDSPHWNKNIIQFEDFTTIITTRSIIIAGIQRYLDMDENIEVQEAKVLEEISPFVEQVEEKIRRIEPGFQILREKLNDKINLDSFDLTPLERSAYDLILEGKQSIKDIHQLLKEKGHNISMSKLHLILAALADRGLLLQVGTPEGFHVKRLSRGALSGKILAREFAFEHDAIAERVKHMRIDNDEGKPRIIVDQSKGFAELETVDKETSAQDAEQYRKNTLVLATADLRDALQVIKGQVSLTTELSRHAVTTQDQIDQVIGILGTLTKLIRGGMP